MQLRKTILASVVSAALALSAAACGTAENTQSVCSAAAETTGSALVLSRGVIEEIVSGLFESAANEDLPDIPDSLSGEISYDADSDTYARPISGGGFSADIQDCVKSGDVYTVTAALIRDENEAEPQAIFTAELVPNPREDNTVFIYSIRTVKQIS